MISASSVLDQAGRQLGGFLPRVAGALLLLAVGLVVAAILGRVVRSALTRVGLDRHADRWGVPGILQRAGLGRSLAHLVGIAVRVTISVVVVFAALSLLGLQFLSESLNQGVLFVPKVLAGLALLLAGLVLGAYAGERVERTGRQMDLPIAGGSIVQVFVIAVFAITAAAQVTVSIALLMVILAIALGGLTATLALAFGLGSREIARALSAGRYVRVGYELGQTIRLGDVTGRIESIDAVTTVLRTEAGAVRVPNNLLIESVVLVTGE